MTTSSFLFLLKCVPVIKCIFVDVIRA